MLISQQIPDTKFRSERREKEVTQARTGGGSRHTPALNRTDCMAHHRLLVEEIYFAGLQTNKDYKLGCQSISAPPREV